MRRRTGPSVTETVGLMQDYKESYTFSHMKPNPPAWGGLDPGEPPLVGRGTSAASKKGITALGASISC